MTNLAGLVFLMILPILFGAMAVFVVMFAQNIIVWFKDIFNE